MEQFLWQTNFITRKNYINDVAVFISTKSGNPTNWEQNNRTSSISYFRQMLRRKQYIGEKRIIDSHHSQLSILNVFTSASNIQSTMMFNKFKKLTMISILLIATLQKMSVGQVPCGCTARRLAVTYYSPDVSNYLNGTILTSEAIGNGGWKYTVSVKNSYKSCPVSGIVTFYSLHPALCGIFLGAGSRLVLPYRGTSPRPLITKCDVSKSNLRLYATVQKITAYTSFFWRKRYSNDIVWTIFLWWIQFIKAPSSLEPFETVFLERRVECCNGSCMCAKGPPRICDRSFKLCSVYTYRNRPCDEAYRCEANNCGNNCRSEWYNKAGQIACLAG